MSGIVEIGKEVLAKQGKILDFGKMYLFTKILYKQVTFSRKKRIFKLILINF